MEIDQHRVVRDRNTLTVVDRTEKAIARLRVSHWKRTVAIAAGGSAFLGYFRRWNEPVLAIEDGSIALAIKAGSAWDSTVRFAFGEHEYRLKKARWFALDSLFYLYREDGKRVAGFDRRNTYSHRVLVKFAEELPLEVNLFVLWLVWLSWEQAN